MVRQKFALASTWSAHRQGRAAAIAHRTRDLAAFERHARAAYQQQPDYAGSRVVFALWCVRGGDLAPCTAAFEMWHRADPSQITARWGLAEMRLRSGDRIAARTLLADPLAAGIPASSLANIDRGATSVGQAELRRLFWAQAVTLYFSRAKREF